MHIHNRNKESVENVNGSLADLVHAVKFLVPCSWDSYPSYLRMRDEVCARKRT